MKTLKPLLAVAVVSFALIASGCATMGKLLTPAAQPFIQAAVDVAVATAVQKGVDPQKINAVAKEVLLLDEGATVPLDAIEGVINMKVASMHLPPADQAAVQILMAALDVALKAQIAALTNGAVTSQTQVAIKNVTSDVIVATSAYGVK